MDNKAMKCVVNKEPYKHGYILWVAGVGEIGLYEKEKDANKYCEEINELIAQILSSLPKPSTDFEGKLKGKIAKARAKQVDAEIMALPSTANREVVAKIEELLMDYDGEYNGTIIAKRILSLISPPMEVLTDKPKIICLCGSSRFIETFAVLAWEFEKEGAITLGLHYLPPSYTTKVADHIAEAEGVAKQMDELHRRKIDLADEIFVININGYVGESTAGEIEYATKLGKSVMYLEAISEATIKGRVDEELV